MPNPHGHQSVNVSNGKTSHLLLKQTTNFPDVANPAAPVAGQIIGAVCKDVTNVPPFYFSPVTVIAQIGNKKRLGLRMVSQLPGGGADPTDGQIAITLIIYTGDTTPPDELAVADAPVEYISDPGAP